MPAARTFGLLALYVGSQLTSLALAFPFIHLGLQTTSSPGAITNILPFLVVIVVAPLGIIALARAASNFLVVVKYLILLAISSSLFYCLWPAFSLLLPAPLTFSSGYDIDIGFGLALLVAEICFLTLLLEPQWYVVDGVGFLAAGSLTAVLGISLGLLPVFCLLVALLIYDAIAVYWTKHMLSLADVVSDMKLPILMVVPESRNYDYTASPSFQETRAKVQAHPEEREATFMGLGDVIIPGILVVSAFVFLPNLHPGAWPGTNLLVALGAMLGSLGGYGILMRRVETGNAQAGLPFLNGGAIVGYALVYLALYHSWTLGLTWPF